MTFYKEPLSKIPTFVERDLTLICTSLVIAVISVGGLVPPNEVIFLELTSGIFTHLGRPQGCSPSTGKGRIKPEFVSAPVSAWIKY